MIRQFLRGLMIFFTVLPCGAQLSGYVYDAENALPVADVHVQSSKDTSTSNKEGYFQIGVHQVDSVSFASEGYHTLLFPVREQDSLLMVQLLPVRTNINEVVVAMGTGSDMLNRIPGSISLLTQEDLSESSGKLSTDLAMQLPGVFIQQGTPTTNRVTIRGVGSRTPYSTNRIKAYFGNIPLTNGNGESAIEEIGLTDISRMEVLRGPSSALYGSGLGGTLRFYPVQSAEEGFRLIAQSEAGSFNTWMNHVHLSHGYGPVQVNLNLSDHRSEGFRQNSSYERTGALLTGSLTSGRHRIDLLINAFRVYGQIPSSLDDSTFVNNPEAAAGNWLAVRGYEEYGKIMGGLSLRSHFSSAWMNQTAVSVSLSDKYELRPFNALDDGSAALTLRDFIRFRNEKFSLTLGYEGHFEQYNWKILEVEGPESGELLQHNEELRIGQNLFGMAEIDLQERLVISLAASLNYTRFQLQDRFGQDTADISNSFSFDPVFSPRLGLNYKVWDDLFLYASAGHGYSFPSAEETLLPDGLYNDGLKPETGWSIDLGLRGSIANRRLMYDLTFYILWLEDLLVTYRETEEIFYALNAGKARHGGVEGALQAGLFRAGTGSHDLLTIRFSGSAGNYRFTDFVNNGISYTGNMIPGIPSFAFFTSMEFSPRQIPLNILLESQHTGSQYLTDANDRQAGSWQIWNIRFQYHLKTGTSTKIQLSAAVRNLFDEHYASMVLINAPSFGSAPRYYYPGTPRHFNIGVHFILN